jgi:hypothetical protein
MHNECTYGMLTGTDGIPEHSQDDIADGIGKILRKLQP